MFTTETKSGVVFHVSWDPVVNVSCASRGLTTSVPGPSRWDGDEDPGKIRFIVPKFWGKIACAVRHNRIAIRPWDRGWGFKFPLVLWFSSLTIGTFRHFSPTFIKYYQMIFFMTERIGKTLSLTGNGRVMRLICLTFDWVERDSVVKQSFPVQHFTIQE